jgi:hypothetical protein
MESAAGALAACWIAVPTSGVAAIGAPCGREVGETGIAGDDSMAETAREGAGITEESRGPCPAAGRATSAMTTTAAITKNKARF